MGSAPMTTMMREWEELGGSVVSEYGVLDNYTTWGVHAGMLLHSLLRANGYGVSAMYDKWTT